MSYYDDTYKPQLEEAAEYQDFITDQLLKHGITLNQYSSRKYQFNKGESASGIEVKHDKRMAETGNAYIEIAEKSNPNMESYTKSGINRDDETWLFLIGNYEEALLMSKRQLKKLLRDKTDKFDEWGIRKVQTPTSIAYTVPVEFLDKWLCIKHFKFGGQ